MVLAGVLTRFFKLPPPLAIFGCAALCLCLFFLDWAGVHGDWCHVARYGDWDTQVAGAARCAAAH